MLTKGTRLLPLSFLLLVLAAPCPAQTTRVALIDTNAFTDPKHGITRLVNALSLVEKEFEKRHAKMLELHNLLLRQPSGPGFMGPIPTDPRPMTPERRKQLKEDAEKMRRSFEWEQKELQRAYDKRREEVRIPIFEDILRSLEAFAKARGITLLIDVNNLSCPISCQIESAADINITREFIAAYNRLHP
jgi:hypothetical protein